MAKPRIKLPKLLNDAKGRYFKHGKRKIYVDNKISERELIKFIVGRLTKKRQARKKETFGKALKEVIGKPSFTSSNALKPLGPAFLADANAGKDRTINDFKQLVENQQRKLKDATEDIKLLKNGKIVAVPEAKPDVLVLKNGVDGKYDNDDRDNKVFIHKLANDRHVAQNEADEVKYRTKLEIEQYQKDTEEAKRLAIAAAEELAQEQAKIKLLHKKQIHQMATDKMVKKIQGTVGDNLRELARKNDIDMTTDDKGKELLKGHYIPVALIRKRLIEKKVGFDKYLKEAQSEFDKINVDVPEPISDSKHDDEPVEPQEGEGKMDYSGEMNNHQIDAIMSHYKPSYLGCIASDQILDLLPKIKPRTRICFVINLDKVSQPGSHWCSVFIDARPDGDHSCEYFNSFAEPPTQEFMKDIKTVVKKLDPNSYLKFKDNRVVLQSDDTSNCGEFSIRFLIDRMRNKSFKEATGYECPIKNNHIQGEKEIEKWKQNYKPFQYIMHKQNGGWGSWSVRENYPPKVRKWIAQYGDKPIQALTLNRAPIRSMVRKIANWVSMGKFDENAKRLGYDDVYHAGLLISIDNHPFLLEKNAVINVSNGGYDHGELLSVPFKANSLTLNELLENAKRQYSGNNFFLYESKGNNCQRFVESLLKGSHLNTPVLHKWIYQDSQELLKDTGLFERIANVATDLGAKVDHLVEGTGKRKRRIK